MRSIKYIIAVFLILFALLAFIALITCIESGEVPGERDARAIAEAIISQVSGSHAALVSRPETNMAMTLHVDMSASMGGYVRTDTTFLKVLDFIYRQWTPKLRALSSGYPPGKDNVENPRFFNQQSNYFGGHDMARTVHEFAKDTGRMHLLVTDSQPWDSGNVPAYKEIAAAINAFLSQGGRCVLILYRSAYRGYYPSPLLANEKTKHVFYDCTNRPFALWIFAHETCALNRVVADLANKAGELHWAAKIQFGEPECHISLAARTLPGYDAVSKMGKEIGTIHLVKTGKEVGRVKDYQLIQVRKKALDAQGYVPFQFDIAPINGELPEKLWDNLQKGLAVTLDCWEIPDPLVYDDVGPQTAKSKVKTSASTPQKTSAVAGATASTSRPLKLEKLRRLNLEYALQVLTNAPATNAVGTITNKSMNARLVVAVPRPGPAKRYAWVLAIGPKYSGPSRLLPNGFSTPNDTNPSQADKILNLDEMLNNVAEQTDKYGSMLFLTDYPK